MIISHQLTKLETKIPESDPYMYGSATLAIGSDT